MKNSNKKIKTKEDLLFFLDADSWAYGYKHRPKFALNNINLRYQRYLRFHEYYSNNNRKILSKFYGFRHIILGFFLGFTIPINVFDAGLKLNHHGCIIVNSQCIIGKWCDIHNCVNIGDNGYYSETGEAIHCTPIIGDHVHICPGAKIFGKIKIDSDVVIGSNAVVNKDIPSYSVVVGNPPIIKEKKKRLLSITDQSVEDSFLRHYPQYKKYFRD